MKYSIGPMIGSLTISFMIFSLLGDHPVILGSGPLHVGAISTICFIVLMYLSFSVSTTEAL